MNCTQYFSPLQRTFPHDAYGNVTHLVDALGNLTTTTYDATGRLLSETITRTKADGTSEALVTSYEYDANGNRTKTIRADGSVETTAYDPRARWRPAPTLSDG